PERAGGRAYLVTAALYPRPVSGEPSADLAPEPEPSITDPESILESLRCPLAARMPLRATRTAPCQQLLLLSCCRTAHLRPSVERNARSWDSTFVCALSHGNQQRQPATHAAVLAFSGGSAQRPQPLARVWSVVVD